MMNNQRISIELPTLLLKHLKKSKRVFLSVNPVIAFSDVLIEIEKQLSTDQFSVDIISADKLSSLTESNTDTALIACGDMPLKELPSYLRGIVNSEGLQEIIDSISASPWLALRVHLSNSGNHLYEFLPSDSIENNEVNLCDSSWTNSSLLATRFDQSFLINNIGDSVTENGSKDPIEKTIGSDLEFME